MSGIANRKGRKERPTDAYGAPTWDPDKGPSDRQIEDAIRVLRAEYYTSVRSYADDLARRILAGEITTSDDLEDTLHQEVDGSAWVIYTARAQRVLMCSDYDPSEDVDDAGYTEWAMAAAYYCLKHDIAEQLPHCDGMADHPIFGGDR